MIISLKNTSSKIHKLIDRCSSVCFSEDLSKETFYMFEHWNMYSERPVKGTKDLVVG